MTISRINKFNRVFFFKAKIIYIPTSFDRYGVDPLPRFFVEPIELEHVLKFSESPRSVENGYKLDKQTGLYMKNMETIDVDMVDDQFSWIQMNPPH